MKYTIIAWLSVFCPPELREEDSSDKADEYIENCLGKITDESARVSVSILYCTMLMFIGIIHAGSASHVSPVSVQWRTETQTNGHLSAGNHAGLWV